MKSDYEEVNWSEYCYKENDDDKTWWVDTSWYAKGLMLITFDKLKSLIKKIHFGKISFQIENNMLEHSQGCFSYA